MFLFHSVSCCDWNSSASAFLLFHSLMICSTLCLPRFLCHHLGSFILFTTGPPSFMISNGRSILKSLQWTYIIFEWGNKSTCHIYLTNTGCKLGVRPVVVVSFGTDVWSSLIFSRTVKRSAKNTSDVTHQFILILQHTYQGTNYPVSSLINVEDLWMHLILDECSRVTLKLKTPSHILYRKRFLGG